MSVNLLTNGGNLFHSHDKVQRLYDELVLSCANVANVASSRKPCWALLSLCQPAVKYSTVGTPVCHQARDWGLYVENLRCVCYRPVNCKEMHDKMIWISMLESIREIIRIDTDNFTYVNVLIIHSNREFLEILRLFLLKAIFTKVPTRFPGKLCKLLINIQRS